MRPMKILAAGMLISTPLSTLADDATVEGDLHEVTVHGRVVAPPVSGKIEMPWLENPQAISVVTGSMIETRGITRLADALRTVAGVTRSSTYGYYDAYQIRGYDAAYGSVYLDGLLSSNVAGTNNELAGLEQVEVVKGPASMLYGSAPLGGIVNLVSKRPVTETFFDASLATGSYGLRETTLDANSALTSSETWLGRLNVVYRDSGDFVRHSGKERLYVAPAVTWNIAESTRLTLLTRYQRDQDNPWSPTSAWGTVLASALGELPIDFTINGDDDGADRAIHDQWNKQAGYVFDHHFSEALSFSQTLRYTHGKVFWNNWVFAAGFVDGGIVDDVQQGHVMGRYVYGPFRETDEDFAVDSRMTARLGSGALRHELLLGVDYRRNRSVYSDEGGNFDPTANPLDVLDPDYSVPLVHDPAWAYSGAGKSRQTGFYLQDHIGIGSRFTATLGGRWDEATTDGATDRKFSPRIGATWRLTPAASLYASWSKSFTPQVGYFTVEGDALQPETGRNIEAGLKFADTAGRLTGTLAVFELTRQNVATEDPANPFFYVVTGEQRSRGFEAEALWKPSQPWTLSLAYAYLDAQVTKDNLFTVGAPLANVPENAVNFYGEYVVPGGPLAHLGVSLGLLYNDRKNATLWPEDLDGDGAFDPISLFTLPSYHIVDVGLSYLLGTWQMRLNVNNVADKRYFPDACCVDRVTPGEPRNWRLSVARKF